MRFWLLNLEIVRLVIPVADLAPDRRDETETDRDHANVVIATEIANETARKTALPSSYGTVRRETSLKIDRGQFLKVDLARQNNATSLEVLHATEVSERCPTRPHQHAQCQKSATRPRTPWNISKRNLCQMAWNHRNNSVLRNTCVPSGIKPPITSVYKFIFFSSAAVLRLKLHWDGKATDTLYSLFSNLNTVCKLATN